jgi:hypothetical protein
MALDFYPYQPGQVLTADDLNALVAAIQDGSIFTTVSFVSSMVTTLDARVTTLEDQIPELQAKLGVLFKKKQISLTTGQSIIGLDNVPMIDSEIIALNGVVLAKTGTPIGFVGDYVISGSTVTLATELALQIINGDRLVITYAYNV